VAEKQVDARGLACPQPVVLTRKAMQEAGVDLVRVVVDRDVPAENIQRLARSQGWQPRVAREGGDIHLTLTRTEAPAARAQPQPETASVPSAGQPKVVVFVTSDLFGEGDEQLGRILMRAFVKTLKDLDTRPAKLIFANSGVRLTTAGSNLIDDLRSLEKEGVEVISCGTCLDFYGLVDSLEVGVASNMYEIASALVEADRIVQP
jgi:selenium metabolism protein YedF